MLKGNAIKSDKLWKAAGRPLSVHIFELRKRKYINLDALKLNIKENQQLKTQSYTNELREALLKKPGSAYW